ncbi:hypothetical protein PAMP_019392 [Pampus punctatissimus]
MADFPSKVTTETSSSSQQGDNSITVINISFIRSIPAVLMMVEIVLGLLQWALIASCPYTLFPAYGWVMFVAVTLWILTIILFFMILLRVQQKLTFIPWPLTFFGAVVTVAYGASAFLSYLDWKANRGNAATNAVPN